MKNFRDQKFSFKVLVGLFIPLFFVCSTLGLYMLNRMKTEFNTHLDEKGQTVTKLLAKFSATPIITYDYWILEDYIAEVMKDTEILFAVIKDKK